MVLGLSAKNRKEASIHVDYQIHIHEIKPWPPSQSLRSLRSVMIQWQNGDRNFGSTKTVVPSLGAVIGEGKIDFNESFRLPVTMLRDMNVKSKDADTFLKNFVEFNLYEPRRDKTQLLATATIDLADYGTVKETLSINAPMNSKRSFRNTAQPVLFITVQPIEKAVRRTSSSLRDSFSKEASLDKNGGESISALMNEEYAEEAEIASFTDDDDVSSHSSPTVSSSIIETNNGFPRNKEFGSVTSSNSEGSKKEQALASKLHLEKSDMKMQVLPHQNLKGISSRSSSVDLSSELEGPICHAYVFNSPNSSPVISRKGMTDKVQSSSPSFNTPENAEEEDGCYLRENNQEYLADGQTKLHNGKSAINGDAKQNSEEIVSNNFTAKVASSNNSPNSGNSQVIGENKRCSMEEAANFANNCNIYMEDTETKAQEHSDKGSHSTRDEPLIFDSQDVTRNEISMRSDSPSLSREDVGNSGMKTNILKTDGLKNVKSVRSPEDIARGIGHQREVKENGLFGGAQNLGGSFSSFEGKDKKVYDNDSRSVIADSTVKQLKHKIKMLETELTEAAAIEASLYSVIAEHGSSMNKVHAPARRLSRLYLHACKQNCQTRRARAARSAVSGLVLVVKACGNDVPRLTFWLSNSVVLREIIRQATGGPEQPFAAGQSIERNSSQKRNYKITPPLKWRDSSPSKTKNRNDAHGSFGDWEDPHAFPAVLEKVEAWIFSRIIESIWWQTLTPHMQSAAERKVDGIVGSGSRKNLGLNSISSDQDQVNFSLDHWKKAFREACERLCPVRAAGHECGCLSLLPRLIMEQCVVRLDVAMFNAILRESADEIPTDPISDPISDSMVLPISAGKSSFGAGAHLKNAIGNWSRWLSDLFGMDDGESPDENEHDSDGERQDSSFKSFHLLNALSDLMMLPKDLLLSRSIRKEVCPTFGAPLIKRVLDNFVPDEFCPDPIPRVVLEVLDSEELEAGEESITNFRCIAAPPLYTPLSADCVASFIGEFRGKSQLRRSRSSVLRKSYTSDDELDELNSPLASIFIGSSLSSPAPTSPSWRCKGNNNQSVFRYELLRDIWMNGE